MGIIRKELIRYIEYKWMRDFAGLWKNIFEFLKHCMVWRRNQKLLVEVQQGLCQCDHYIISPDSLAYQMIRDYLFYRKKQRFIILGIFKNLLRITMLLYRLQIPYLKDTVSPILAIMCGIGSNLIAIFRQFREKK
mmetsp:Transcript_40713/g.39315  ORF Transcript_40713/g.39315 Transcript_40713/m.39315 type:complete len:135 (+) Transcript_40713:438-842(+)